MRIFGSFLFMIFILAGCKNADQKKADMISKRWKYEEFKMNDEIFKGAQLGNPQWEFFDDGKYTLEFGEMTEQGTWKVKGNELITASAEEPDLPNHLKIEELSEQKLVLYSEVEGDQAFITLVPAPADEK